MPELISTPGALFHFLLLRMRLTESMARYPALYVTFVDGLVACLAEFADGTARLLPRFFGRVCPRCGSEEAAVLLASLTSSPVGTPFNTCNRHFAALAPDLLVPLPLGLTRAEVTTAMVAVLGFDRDGLVRISRAGRTTCWETSTLGERQLGVRIRVA